MPTDRAMERSSESDRQDQNQDQGLIYALDIGTRSVIGMLGRVDGEKVNISSIEKRFHTRRVMMDGQIEDIDQVAAAVSAVTRKLEQVAGCRLVRACVAAAGRALRTERGRSKKELPAPQQIDSQLIAQLEAAAVADAENALRKKSEGDQRDEQRQFLVGYTVTHRELDGYPLSNLLGHTGRILEAEVVATFLPNGVIDSLYAVMRKSGLEVASLTLEPIAALNAAIPEELRLLNLCLVDIGAGTSDIAVCRDGGVVGYTMATVAGDEITEALMREYLVDYATAERLKESLSQQVDSVKYTNILGEEEECSCADIEEVLAPAVEQLAREIAGRVLELNGSPPSAVFLAGGGSKLPSLRQRVADALEMEQRRVAVAGGHFKNSVYSDSLSLDDPEYTTPLGIAVSAGLGLISDSCQVLLNGTRAKLFRSGSLTAMELLMMNGYTYSDLIGRTGKPLIIRIDGRRTVFYGQPAQPAVLRINGVNSQPSAIVRAGDSIDFTPAIPGEDCSITAAELVSRFNAEYVTIDGRIPEPNEQVAPGSSVVLVGAGRAEPQTDPVEPEREPAPESKVPAASDCSVILNGKTVMLPAKPDGMPHYLMDLLELSGIDFKHVERPVALRVNGVECGFQQVLSNGDRVDICYEDEVV